MRLILAAAPSTEHPCDRGGQLTLVAPGDIAKATSGTSGVEIPTTEESEKTHPKCLSPVGESSPAALHAMQTEKQLGFSWLALGLYLFALSLIYCVSMTVCCFFYSVTTPLRPFTTLLRLAHTLSYHHRTMLLFYFTLFSVNICSNQVLLII